MDFLFIQRQTNWYNKQSEKLMIARQRMALAKIGRTIDLVDRIVLSVGGTVSPQVKKLSDALLNLTDDILISKSKAI